MRWSRWVGSAAVGASVWLRGVGGLSFTCELGSAPVALRASWVALDRREPRERAINGSVIEPTSVWAALPIAERAPNTAAPARSLAKAAEDINAGERATLATVFFIRVPPLHWLGPNDDTMPAS
jgi:hypothetical protein